MKVREIPLEKIFIKKNIRTDTDEELGEQMQSMVNVGQLQPIGVYPRGERYEIVWGHRRYRAAQMNNDSTIACHVLDPAVIPESMIPILKLQENMVRKQLTTDEILAAVDAIRAAHPGLSDKEIDRMLGKHPGYIGFRRSISTAHDYLARQGLDRRKLASLTDCEVIELRARMESREKPARANKGAFHRAAVPKTGFDIVNSKGPNVVVICASSSVKSRVVRMLHGLRKTIA